MGWRKTGIEYERDAIIRCLRRDALNGGNGWRQFYLKIADKLEHGELLLSETHVAVDEELVAE